MSNPITILVVAKEKNLRSTLDRIFKQAGYCVLEANSTSEAQAALCEQHIDLLFLDLYTPEGETSRIVSEIHLICPHLPILILAARPGQPAALTAIHSGARDYLAKPIDPVQILDRVRTVLLEGERQPLSNLPQTWDAAPSPPGRPAPPSNYASSVDPNRFLRHGPLFIDLHARQVSLASRFVPLPSRAFDTLVTLARHAPYPVTAERIALETFPLGLPSAKARRLVRRQIFLLRTRLETDPYHPQHILRVPGSGYRLSV